jgi:RNA polymerase sigma-70 factor (ECF subfamily)
MGVLQMTMPVAGIFPGSPRGRRNKPLPAGPVAGTGAPLARPIVPAAAAKHGAGEPPLSGGTLLPQAKPYPQAAGYEATLQRTPEQEAAQQALGRLVRQCMAGDQLAWQQLVVSQHRRIYAICYRFTGSASDAEDLTQDVFLKLYRNLASFDLQKGSFQTWITTLARNLLVDHFRRTRLDRATDSLDASLSSDEDGPSMADRLADPRPSQEAHASGLELKVRIQQALAQLSPELREAVVLRDLEDMDYKEIAQVLRIPEGTVKSRISRGRGELARLLQRIEGQVV